MWSLHTMCEKRRQGQSGSLNTGPCILRQSGDGASEVLKFTSVQCQSMYFRLPLKLNTLDLSLREATKPRKYT